VAKHAKFSHALPLRKVKESIFDLAARPMRDAQGLAAKGGQGVHDSLRGVWQSPTAVSLWLAMWIKNIFSIDKYDAYRRSFDFCSH
jgi:hypothetical protein